MIPRFCLAAVLLAPALDLRAQTPTPLPTNPPSTPAPTAPAAATPPTTGAAAIPNLPDPDQLVTLNLPDGDIDSVLTALEMFTGRIVLRPAALATATYHIPIKKPIPKPKAIVAIETVLALNQVGVTPLGDKFLKVTNLQQTKQEAPEMITGSTLDQPPSGKIATKLFQLEFMRVAEFVPLIQAVLNPYFGGPVQLPGANAFLITDSVTNLQRIEALLQQLDKPNLAGMTSKFYPLTNASATGVVNKLRSLLTGPLQVQLGTATNYQADERTNQVIVFTDPRQIPFFDDLIRKLDVSANQNTTVDVIYLNHAKAADVVSTLSKIISGQTAAAQRQSQQAVRPGQTTLAPQPVALAAPGAPVQPNVVGVTNLGGGEMSSNEFSQTMTVANDERSNSIVVSGTADDVRLLRKLVEKLDIVLTQVNIEVVIAEVTLDDQHASGISQLGLNVQGDKLIGFTGALASPPGTPTPQATIGAPNNSGMATLSPIGIAKYVDLSALITLNTTPRKTNSTIVSQSAIVTSHGKKATFFDGETRPVVTGVVSAAGAATSGLSTSSSVTQQQIGTTLTVTPFIGADGTVNLDITQDVQDVTGNVQVDNNQQYIIGDRKTESNVTARSGDIIVLGGFHKHVDQKSSTRLGPIPILGDLLGARNSENRRIELIFFMRPTVLTNNSAIDNTEAMRRVDKLPAKDEIRSTLDPNYQPPKKPLLDKILPH